MRKVPGVNPASYAQALQRFAQIVGNEYVFTSDADLDTYRDGYSILWGEPDELIAAGAVAPSSVEQVQAIVRIANQYAIPLYAISTGRNLGYGGSAPVYSGSVVLDLKRMNKVLEVNEEQHYCIVEPGVSFFDLYDELRRRNTRLQVSQPAPGWGSPIGNALDHGRGGPAGDNFRNACGMEVVLGTGELLRTGMGALPLGKTWATFPDGVGPTLDGIFSQSNFGIITKMGFNLFPWPDALRRLTIQTRNYADLDAMVATCNRLQAMAVGHGSGVFSPLGTIQTPSVVEIFKRRGGGTAAQINQLARDQNVPVWVMNLEFSGPEKVIQAQYEVATELLSAIAGLELKGGEIIHAPQDIGKLSDDAAAAFGKPSLQRFWEDTAQFGWDGHLWFSPLLPQTGPELRKAQQVLGDVCREMDFYWGMPPALLYNSTSIGPAASAYCIVKNFNVSKSDHAHNRRTREVVTRLIQAAADNGWSEYRSVPALQEAVMATFSFNDHAFMRTCERIKDALDPNGILSAGRYGIWPRHLRKVRT
ncbi:MAG TPA: FAD-binding oxidoreductase [Steroidobacteraceae bacterium]|jgi:4-cresol dehydrogenase (hydroxylating)|nr:FAD-binding oxidoreductase [Steroidobacteraceae bacterium]